MLKLYVKTSEVKNAHETLKLLEEKAKCNCPSWVFTNYGTKHPEVLEYLFWKFLENSKKKSVILYFFEKSANKTLHKGLFSGTFLKSFESSISKNTPPDGCLWDYLGKLSWQFLFYESVVRKW